MNFGNKVVLITGASSGIGACTAENFARFNGKLALVGRNEKRLKDIAKKCTKETDDEKTKPLVIVADVTKEPEKIMKKVIDHFGKLDILINSAGIMQQGSIETITVDQFDKVMKTNVRAVFEMTKHAVPHLIKTKGNIVNVSSVAGIRSFENMIGYCMSKAAMDQFTRCMSLDLAGKKVRVNSVNPGLVKTDIFLTSGMDEKAYNEYLEQAVKLCPLGRAGDPYDVVKTILFLANDDVSSFTTGVIVPIDGGKSNQCPR